MDYDSGYARQMMLSLYARTGAVPWWDANRKHVDELAGQLKNEPYIREQYQDQTEMAMSTYERMIATDPLEAQLQISNTLQRLNTFKRLDWGSIDPAFGLWLEAKIGQSNLLLDRIEREHPELKPHINEQKLDLLIRSQEERDAFIQQNDDALELWGREKSIDPKQVRNSIAENLEYWRSYAERVNWLQIDPEFGIQFNRQMEAAEQMQGDIEREHPELRTIDHLPKS
ncbi:MAG: hypothetical protein ABWZ88_15995 [Variovorax sp.]